MSKLITLSLVLVVCLTSCMGQNIEVKKVREHIQVLAGNSYEGRGTGSAGEAKANEYIEKQFKKMGLAPKGDNGFDQSFTYKAGAHGEGEAGTEMNIA
jgi:hypothetical protein